MEYVRLSGLATLATAALSLPAAAATLAPGGTVHPTGTSVAANPDLAGAVLNDNLITAFIQNGIFAVGYDVQNRVTQSNNTGELIFGPRILSGINNGFSETFRATGFDLTGFGDFDVDADFRTDGNGHTGFSSISRSVDGDRLSFVFSSPLVNGQLALDPHEESLFPALVTNAIAFDTSGTMTIFGFTSENPGTVLSITISGLAAPTAVVPLPAALPLFLGGLGLFGFVGRRRYPD